MDCETFRGLPDRPGDAAWAEHFERCRPCADGALARRVRDRGADPAWFPCVHLAEQATRTCATHDDPSDCPDAVVLHAPIFDEYGIPVRDGEGGAASSSVLIRNCPWCGVALPPSRRAAWFDALARRGFVNPLGAFDQLPEEFLSDAWWRAGSS